MQSDCFHVRKRKEVEFEIKKSRFIGVIMPAQSEQDALRQLQQLASQHAQANHLAFAWRIRQPDGKVNERLFDAGEPSGTAGRPILAPMQGENLIDTVVAVIRYFGGVKLGTGGLTKAYGQAAKQVMAAATIVSWIEMQELQLTLEYPQLQIFEYQLKQVKGKILNQEFTDSVKLTIRLPKSAADEILAQFTAA